MAANRPLNKNPLSIRLPITAWVSVLHRISGVVIFLYIPFLLWGFSLSLSSPKHWQSMVQYFGKVEIKVALWVTLAAITFHLLAGLRHMVMDLHVADSLKAGHRGAWLVMLLSLIGFVALAWWIWR